MTNLERLQARLDMYYKAEEAILTGQEYRVGTRSLKRADLSEVSKMITEIEKKIAYEEKGGKNKSVRGVPLDI
ncbi:DUF6148 family protein [Lachnotalea glycerini]|uniref:GpW protein n=1 Tax=Lachnotalea glycerini TaxID=1763509 RepID=A0A371JC09_9FIRM|nr:DUF6148 family protein [Lachnotalea glycerini]RDY30300.1 hypothetical protein CG710_015310 [Lachnotalea glycerini]